MFMVNRFHPLGYRITIEAEKNLVKKEKTTHTALKVRVRSLVMGNVQNKHQP